jgi:hypothetical protein
VDGREDRAAVLHPFGGAVGALQQAALAEQRPGGGRGGVAESREWPGPRWSQPMLQWQQPSASSGRGGRARHCYGAI